MRCPLKLAEFDRCTVSGFRTRCSGSGPAQRPTECVAEEFSVRIGQLGGLLPGSLKSDLVPGLCQAEGGEGPQVVAGGVAKGGCDVGVAVLAVDADGEVAQAGHDAG